jgi:predicted DNA-binding transcriptional regulator YafY
MWMSEVEAAASLTSAIKGGLVVRLGYSPIDGGPITLHRVAPIDIRPGDSESTRSVSYLWAYCFDRHRVEKHRLPGIRTVTVTEERFDTTAVMNTFREQGWQVPGDWVVSRDWA